MNAPMPRTRLLPLSLIAAASIGLVACSKGESDVAPPVASMSASSPVVAMAPAPVPAPAPTVVAPAPAPVVVAQNDVRDDKAYQQGRRDAQREEARRLEREKLARQRAETKQLPPRADRDDYVNEPRRVVAAACTNCGVVQSVSEVKVQGTTNGVGAVAGGVGGALLGNRIAGSNNRTVGGVVGAVGGGLIGNAIEKHQRQSVAYDVTVRMDDGSLRTVRQQAAPTIGEKVKVESDGLHSAG